MHNSLLLIFCSYLLVGCKNETVIQPPSIQLSEKPLNFLVYANGELDAVKSTPITAPTASRRSQTLAWIVPQFTQVKAGDVVARFDGANFQLEADESEFELKKLAFSALAKQREINMNLEQFDAESLVVNFEYLMAQEFNIDNPLLYTKIEMIDAAADESFLEAKTEHLDQKKENYSKKSETELAVLNSSEKLQKSKLELNQSSLSGLEVKAPHDGMVVLERDWAGSLPLPGKAIFAGAKLASLPDLSTMMAKIYVPEVEAIGIQKGQPVKIYLDAFPGALFTATIDSVSQTAQPRDRESPVKYYTITALINEKDTNKLIPGQRLQATIEIGSEKTGIIAPLQSIFRQGSDTWVYLKKDNVFIKNKVQTGTCSATQCEIIEGLHDKDIIALSEPVSNTKPTAENNSI